MPGRSFSLSKYPEQGKCNLKLRNPSGSRRHGAVSLLYSAYPLRTVTQTDRQCRKARERREVPNPTRRRRVWGQYPVSRLSQCRHAQTRKSEPPLPGSCFALLPQTISMAENTEGNSRETHGNRSLLPPGFSDTNLRSLYERQPWVTALLLELCWIVC